MPQVLGQGTTFNLPNYVGELFNLTPADTPFLSMIGGLTGGRQANSIEFGWQAQDMREGMFRARQEGQAAPQAEQYSRLNLSNVVQIQHESVEVSYTKLAATQQLAGVNNDQRNPVTDELQHQIGLALRSMALDVEHDFINGRYAKPVDNTAPRKTRGIIEAIEDGVGSKSNAMTAPNAVVLDSVAVTVANDRFTKASHGLTDGTQVVVEGGEDLGFSGRRPYYVVNGAAGYFSLAETPGGSAITPEDDGTVDVIATAPVDSEDVIDLLQRIWENGGIRESETATILVGAANKRLLTAEFVTGAGYQESSRTVGGVHVMTIETDFGTLNVALSRYVPATTMVVVSADECAPVFLPIPGKGYLFYEPLSKTGSSEKGQIYGEIGLEYGNPLAHGYLRGVKV